MPHDVFSQIGIPVAVVFGLSLLATWVVRALAQRRGWMELPRADRWHRLPRARLGGVAIFVAFAGGVVVFGRPDTTHLGLLAFTGLMFGVGLTDDLASLRPPTKLVAQIAAALGLYFLGYHFDQRAPFGLDLLLVVVWVVGITNAFNLLDNMDGLAAGVAVIAALFRVLLFLSDGNPEGALISAVLLAAAAGFLVFNFSPASIFMGDCGSFVLGFVLAALNLRTSEPRAENLLTILLFPVLVLALPIFDTALVSTVRWLAGRSISRGGADHTSHRLVAVGLSERRAVLILYAISGAAGGIAFVLYRGGLSYVILGAALATLGLVLFGILLGTVSLYDEKELDRRVGPGEPPGFALPGEWRYKRATLWIAVDVLAIFSAYYAAYLLRFGSTFEWEHQFQLFVRSAPVLVATILVTLLWRGLYRSEWKHFSLHEARVVVTGTTVGLAVSVVLLTYLFRFEGYSRSVFVLTWGAAILVLGGSRLFVRSLADALRPGGRASQRTLIYGAGAAGELALAETALNRSLDQLPVGFLDDDVFKHRTAIRGVPVLGGLDALPFLARKYAIDAVLVSSDKIPLERQMRLSAMAGELGIEVYRVRVSVMRVEQRASR